MAKIKKIFAREILDSRGQPTVEATVVLDNEIKGAASVPVGASVGRYEALELRDNDPERFLGKGVLKACQNVGTIIGPALIGQEITDQAAVDQKIIELDGTENKSRLGANAILSVSLAAARAAAKSEKLPLYNYLQRAILQRELINRLPIPMFNIINGGKHSDSGLTIQEFMIVPMKETSFKERLETGAEIFYALRDILMKRGLTFAVGDEGGFAPKLKTTERVFNLLADIARFTKHQIGKDVFFALDVAASVFYQSEKKKYLFEGKKYSSEKMLKTYYKWFKNYPLISIEDPFAEDDWSAWSELTSKLTAVRSDFLIIGDDLFTTNLPRLEEGIKLKAANAILIKPNQIGTLTETVNCVKLAQKNNYRVIISHRSGETNDDFIADLAVAVGADFIKAGAPNRGERVAKYNRLLEIEKELEK